MVENTLFDFKIYCMAIVTKTYDICQRTDIQIKGIENPDKGNSLEKKTVFSTNGAKINWISTCKTMIFNPYLAPYMKINSRWITD